MPSMITGALAGLIGTAAMTAAQTAEMRVTGRAPSTVPGRVASKLLRLKPQDDAALARISIRMHWAHGMAQGTVRALIGRLGLQGPTAAGAHFALMWSSDAMLYKALGIAPWPVGVERRRAGPRRAAQGPVRGRHRHRVRPSELTRGASSAGWRPGTLDVRSATRGAVKEGGTNRQVASVWRRGRALVQAVSRSRSDVSPVLRPGAWAC